MPYLSDSLPAITPVNGLRHPTLADVVDSLAETLGAALAHSSHATLFESRRQMERLLGRPLDAQFAQELLTLLLAPGSEGRDLRAAFIKLMSMTESREWLESLAPGSFATSGTEDEAQFLSSAAAASARELAQCTACIARTAAECAGEVPAGETQSGEAAANRQWIRCAECRCGIGADFTPECSSAAGR